MESDGVKCKHKFSDYKEVLNGIKYERAFCYFIDCEPCLIEDIKPLISGEWEVKSCKQVQFYDLIPNPEGDRWYKARVEMITVEDNGKETRKAVSIYVQAGNVTEANKVLHQSLSNLDCEVVSITRSPILEVLRAV